MGYFDTKENVQNYISMAKGFDGKDLIKKLKAHLPKNSSILELGMGPGKDLNILKKNYIVTGSDNSTIFLDLYKNKHPDTPLFHLDAVTIKTKLRFQALYSNKVLHHLTRKDLKASLKRQSEVLKRKGIVAHSFWKGVKQERFQGILFVYYSIKQLVEIFSAQFEILEIGLYSEMKKEDSIYVFARKK